MLTRSKKTALLTLFAASLATLCLSSALPSSQKDGQKKDISTSLSSGIYAVDGVHSTVIFRVKHVNATWAYGRFNEIKGSVNVDVAKPESSSVSVEIEIDSIDTGNEKRDGHLKSPDFFDAVQFSTATFVSKSIKKTGDATYSVTGDFELHGVKKSLTVDFEHVGSSNTKMGVRAGFHGVFDIKRSEFGMKFMPDMLGDDVRVIVSLETTQTDAK